MLSLFLVYSIYVSTLFPLLLVEISFSSFIETCVFCTYPLICSLIISAPTHPVY